MTDASSNTQTGGALAKKMCENKEDAGVSTTYSEPRSAARIKSVSCWS